MAPNSSCRSSSCSSRNVKHPCVYKNPSVPYSSISHSQTEAKQSNLDPQLSLSLRFLLRSSSQAPGRNGTARSGDGASAGGPRRRLLRSGGRRGVPLEAARGPRRHRLPQARPSSARRRGRVHGDVVPERDAAGGRGRGLQVRQGEPLLRAGEPEGAGVAQDQRRPEEGQDVPVQGRPAALRRGVPRQGRVPRRPRHPHGHLLRARLRARCLRHAGRLRPDKARRRLRRRQHHRRHHLHQGRRRRVLGLLRRLPRLLLLHREPQEEQLGWTLGRPGSIMQLAELFVRACATSGRFNLL